MKHYLVEVIEHNRDAEYGHNVLMCAKNQKVLNNKINKKLRHWYDCEKEDVKKFDSSYEFFGGERIVEKGGIREIPEKDYNFLKSNNYFVE